MALTRDPGQLIEITEQRNGRFVAAYTEWNGCPSGCRGHDHITRTDALACAEARLRYRA
jgi:hypothetical protein